MTGLIPSGHQVGIPVSALLVRALGRRGIPAAAYPVIEEGTYDDFKACAFRVCAGMAYEVALSDMTCECHDHGIRLDSQRRKWDYGEHNCVTVVQLRMAVSRECAIDIKDFFDYLSKKYGFVYSHLSLTQQGYRRDHLYENCGIIQEVRTELEVEIMWPYWM